MSLAAILARTAARKAEGADQTYPQHAGRAAVTPSRVALPVRAACVHEGAILEPCTTCGGDLRSVRDCDRHERATRVFVSGRVRSCDRCPDYRAEGDSP